MSQDLYSMDATTWDRLVVWTGRETRTGEEAYHLAHQMKEMLETFTPVDADYSMGHG